MFVPSILSSLSKLYSDKQIWISAPKKCHTDRLSSLPEELLCRVLSLLPTKDAAIASLSFKKMGNAFMYLTALDFDDSPISYCAFDKPQLIERFPIFETFVDNVLRSCQSPHLSKFRLGFGGDMTIASYHFPGPWPGFGKQCFPHLESTKLDAWIRFPLSRYGVKEIDLRIHVREPEKLSSALFSCETLEVLKLDTNLDFELVCSMSSFRLPNLKVLELHSIIIPEDEFVGRLVSNCPLLEELCINCWWKYGKTVVISSPSLQKLVLCMNRDCQSGNLGDLLSIDTRNLQYFKHKDKLSFHNYVISMKALVQASIDINYNLAIPADQDISGMVYLMQAVSNVQHLNLMFSCLEFFDYEDLENQLPIFQNLKHLKFDTNSSTNWDEVLFKFLIHSPVLEVLEFPRGIGRWFLLEADPQYQNFLLEPDPQHQNFLLEPDPQHQNFLLETDPQHQNFLLELDPQHQNFLLELDPQPQNFFTESEPWIFRKNQVNPYCCKPHLKRIINQKYHGTTREVELVGFLLENAPALQELLIKCEDDIDSALAESTLKKLPMVSSSCLIIVQ